MAIPFTVLNRTLKQRNVDEVEGSDDHHEALRMMILSASIRVALSLLKVTSLPLLPTLLRTFIPDVR